MRKITKSILLLTSAVCLSSSQLSAVTTDPVGYITLTVKGTGGSSSEVFSFVSPSLQNPIVGRGTVNSVTPNNLGFSSNVFADLTLDELFFVEVTEGDPGVVGLTATIVSNSANSLETEEDISSLLSGNETVAVRKYTSISDLFGETNSSGLTSAETLSQADQILIPREPEVGGFSRYFYLESARSSGWRESNDLAFDASETPIPVGQGLIIRRVASSDITITVAGSVIMNDSAVYPIEEGFNFIATAYPVAYSLNTFFGVNGGALTTGATLSAADQVQVADNQGNLQTYFYLEGSRASGWRNSNDLATDVGADPVIQPGNAVLVNRRLGSGFNFAETKSF